MSFLVNEGSASETAFCIGKENLSYNIYHAFNLIPCNYIFIIFSFVHLNQAFSVG